MAAVESAAAAHDQSLLAKQKCNDRNRRSDDSEGRRYPERKHPLDQLAFEFCEALFELRVKSSKVQIIQLAKIIAIRGVHAIEPVHELVREVLSERFVELAGQSCGDRHPRM